MKRLVIIIVFLLSTVQLLAQTQYDYYEGNDAYGGIDTAITGFKVIGIIVLIIAAILVIAAVYGLFAGWFKKEDDIQTDVQPTILSQKTNLDFEKESRTNNVRESNVPIEKHSEIITIEGNIIEGNLTQKDGSKKNEWYWYDIVSIKHNLTNDITHKIGMPVIRKGSSWYLADHLDKSDLLYNTLRPTTFHLELKVCAFFDPAKLQLMRIDGFNNLYDWTIWYYDGEAQRQDVVDEKRVIEVLHKTS